MGKFLDKLWAACLPAYACPPPSVCKSKLEPDWLKHWQRLDVKAGDIIVLRHPAVLSSSTAANIKAVVIDTLKPLGKDVRVLILEENMEIGVLRKENQPLQDSLDDGGAP